MLPRLRTVPFGSFATAVAIIGLAVPAPAALTLELTDGTSVTVDRIADADPSTLTITAARETARVARSLPWDRIASATLDGERYSAEELRLALDLAEPPHVRAELVSPQPVLHCPPPFPIPDSPFPTRPPGRVISVQPDPLSAYADLDPAVYPAGIPTTEAPFARAVLRERRRLEAVPPFGALSFSAPTPWSAPIPPAPLVPPPPPALLFSPLGP